MATISRSEASLINYNLGQAVGGSGVAAVDVIVVEIEVNDGASGLGFSYVLGGGGGIALQAAKLQLESFVQGFPLTPARHLWQQISRSFNRLGLGVNLIALAAIDTAVWDLHARRQNVPLGVAMGGKLRAVPVYGSGGFNYLGEWHSHPSFSVHPSAHDLSTMTDIVEDRGSNIAFAVLLILRLRFRLWMDHSLMIFACGQPPQQTDFSKRIVFI